MINLECVATFLAVANQGGFREAARQTGQSQPAVTQHIKRVGRESCENLGKIT